VALYPLTFEPRLLKKMWGGRKLHDILGKTLPPGEPIGESWEIYDFPPGTVEGNKVWLSAAVAAGPLKGKTLHELMVSHERDLLGDVPPVGPHRQFPLLIKFLDAKEDLSIQVHPDWKYAAAHPDAFLKSEAWYIVQSDPHARLFKGLVPGTTPEEFRHAIAEGHCERLLNTLRVKPGECYYLPSGTVHAVGAGILAAEVQTPSDTTFRVYDFNRVDPSTGSTRKLHVEQALECIHFSDPSVKPQTADPAAEDAPLAKCEYFEIDEIHTPAGTHRPLPTGRPVIWMMLDGHASVQVRDSSDPVRFKRGDTVLLPAAMADPVLLTHGHCRWLEVRFPR